MGLHSFIFFIREIKRVVFTLRSQLDTKVFMSIFLNFFSLSPCKKRLIERFCERRLKAEALLH